jgi:2-dehydropantoate 2-reductase
VAPDARRHDRIAPVTKQEECNMRILVVGAGAIGGYFGGRLVEAGRDVTFLVRPRRAQELATSGLVIRSPKGDATLHGVKTVQADTIGGPFDLVILSCKAYDLNDAIVSFAAGVGPDTLILPLLNGMRHLDTLDARFGARRVLGGLCIIAATLDKERAIVHLNDLHALAFGARDTGVAQPVDAVAATLRGANFDARHSDAIMQDMWEKWVFLASLASSTCLFRGAVGDILNATGGGDCMLAILDECRAVAEANGHPPRADSMARGRGMLSAVGSSFTASMLRDIENNSRTEADRVVGDLIERAGAMGRPPVGAPLLKIVYTHLKTYEARRARTSS